MATDSTTSSSGVSSSEELDKFFNRDIKHAKRIIKQLKRPRDREIGARLISRAEALKADSLEVKSNRNRFTRYLLRVLMRTHQTQPNIYDIWFKDREIGNIKHTSLWSSDRRTYVATKNIPGFGMLVYLAVSHQPELGWEENGFLSYEF